jgi:hypothetical protein
VQVPGVVGARVVVVVGAGVVVVVVVVVVDVVAVHCTGVGPAKFALPYILARVYRPPIPKKMVRPYKKNNSGCPQSKRIKISG